MKLKDVLIIALALMTIMIAVVLGLYSNDVTQTKHKFTQFCAENKGIAVRDLDNKMRCVPMFSAKGRS